MKIETKESQSNKKFALEIWRIWFSTQLTGDTALSASDSDSGTQ